MDILWYYIFTFIQLERVGVDISWQYIFIPMVFSGTKGWGWIYCGIVYPYNWRVGWIYHIHSHGELENGGWYIMALYIHPHTTRERGLIYHGITVECRYNAVFGAQEIDRVIAAGSAMDVFWLVFKKRDMSDIRELFIPAKIFDRVVDTILC